jgi:hypothetical protein
LISKTEEDDSVEGWLVLYKESFLQGLNVSVFCWFDCEKLTEQNIRKRRSCSLLLTLWKYFVIKFCFMATVGNNSVFKKAITTFYFKAHLANVAL